LVLEGCNGEIVRAIEQCLAVDDARNNSRRSISSSESGSSSQIPTAIDSKITNISELNQQNLTGTMGLAGQGTGAPGLGGPTSPAEFFRNLTSTQNAGRPILPTFPHYMPPPSLFLPCLYPGLAGLGATQLNSLQDQLGHSKWKTNP